MEPQTAEHPTNEARPDAEASDITRAALDKPYAVPEVESFDLDGLTVFDGDALTANGRV